MLYPWLAAPFMAFAQRANQHSLHHGLLFTGARDLGKADLARALAKKLLCSDKQQLESCNQCKSCLLMDAGSHPDYQDLISDKSQIGIDLVRGAIAQLNQTAQLSGNKVLVISGIELMSPAASNALLKTLEEPTNNTFLLLTCNQANRILPTILSRCEKLQIAPPSLAQSQAWLLTQGVEDVSEAALRAYDMSPIAYQRASKENSDLSFDSFGSALDDLRTGRVSSDQAADKWQHEAVLACRWLAQHMQSIYAQSSQDSSVNASADQAYKAYQKCLQAATRLNHPGLNKRLLLSVLFAGFVSTNQQINR